MVRGKGITKRLYVMLGRWLRVHARHEAKFTVSHFKNNTGWPSEREGAAGEHAERGPTTLERGAREKRAKSCDARDPTPWPMVGEGQARKEKEEGKKRQRREKRAIIAVEESKRGWERRSNSGGGGSNDDDDDDDDAGITGDGSCCRAERCWRGRKKWPRWRDREETRTL